MSLFKETSYLSQILEESFDKPVLIFIHSSKCNASSVIGEKLEKAISEKEFSASVYIVTVQEKPVLSRKIEEVFKITHESPQIIVVKSGKPIYDADHHNIEIEKIREKIS